MIFLAVKSLLLATVLYLSGGAISLANAMQCIDVPAQCRVSSPWGLRFHPVRKVMAMHRGIDLACPTGTPILAAHEGRSHGYFHYGGGNIVIVDSGNGALKTKYMHNSFLAVPERASAAIPVTRGQKVARSGNTGRWTTGPHLHFEVWLRGQHVDPALYFCDPSFREASRRLREARQSQNQAQNQGNDDMHGGGTVQTTGPVGPTGVGFASEPPPPELLDGTLMEVLSSATESRFMNPSWQAMLAAEQNESRIYAEIAFMRALSMAARQRRKTAEDYMLGMKADLQVLRAGRVASDVEELRATVSGAE